MVEVTVAMMDMTKAYMKVVKTVDHLVDTRALLSVEMMAAKADEQMVEN